MRYLGSLTPTLSLLTALFLRRFQVSLLVLSMLSIGTPVIAQPLKFVTQNFPPFSYLEQGRVSGPAPELIRRVCKEMAIACELDLLPWRRAVRLARKGVYQGLFLIGWNSARSDWLYFSPPLIDTEYGLFVSAPNPLKFKSPESIQGYTVAVFGPSNTSHSLQQLSQESGGVSIKMYPQGETGFRQLSRNRVDAVYSNRDVGLAMLEQMGIKGVNYSGPHRELSYFVGFPKQSVDSQGVEDFSQAYLKLLRSGEIDLLLRPYGIKPTRENF